MAVIHFKTAKGAFAFIAILFIASALAISKEIGIGGSILIIAIGFIVLLFIAAISGSQNTKQKQKELENSYGLEKLRLSLRQHWLTNYKQDDLPIDLAGLFLNLEYARIHLIDFFYTALAQDPRKGTFDKIAEGAFTNPDREHLIDARLYGLALGITLEKVAEETDYKIKPEQIEKTFSSSFKDASFSKNFTSTARKFLKIKSSETKQKWNILEQISYSLLDSTIKREKDDIADPLIINPLRTSIEIAKNAITVDDKLIDTLTSHKLISE